MSERKDLTYSDAIEAVMLNNGYFAPLKLVYKEIWKYKDRSRVAGKTPDYTIQERLQRDNRFIKIGLGVYALTDKLHLLLPSKTPQNAEERIKKRHGDLQGMLLEIGNNIESIEDTYTNDKNRIFQNKTLGSLATLATVPLFTYENIIKESVSFFDVIWFNERHFPAKVFEVESSTDFRDGFIKFMEIQDFIVRFVCVSPQERKDKFERELNKKAFRPIRDRVEFLSYEKVESDYNTSRIERYTY